MIDIDEHIASLPDPDKDSMPPRVDFTPEGAEQAKRDRELKKALLDIKKQTESTAKTILEGPIFKGNFSKDGDWTTLGERRIWQKKTADFRGGVPLLSMPNNAYTFVEVKGVSPEKGFSFSRLDKRNNPRQPSQHEKLTREVDRGNLVWLFIGWWDAALYAMPKPVKYGSRTVNKWYKDHVELTVTLLRWEDWLRIYDSHKYKSIRQKDRHLLDDFRITKQGGRWTLDENHWWHDAI
jgi:hypothetical protein